MTNLFATFEPQGFLLLSWGWLSSLFVVGFLSSSFWVAPNQFTLLLRRCLEGLHLEFRALTDRSFPPGGLLLPLAFFLAIGFMNFSGLVPYFFTSTSHMSCTLSLALVMWLGHVAMAWVMTSEKMLAHLIPLGTPPALMPFMVLIELISSVIRPLTLSVRLAANMIAGHLLMTLLSNQLSPLLNPLLQSIILILALLVVLESAVAIIQSYVFSVLSSLYLAEVSSVRLS